MSRLIPNQCYFCKGALGVIKMNIREKYTSRDCEQCETEYLVKFFTNTLIINKPDTDE